MLYTFMIIAIGMLALRICRASWNAVFPWLLSVLTIIIASGISLYASIVYPENQYVSLLNISNMFGLTSQNLYLSFVFNETSKYLITLICLISFFVVLLSFAYEKYRDNLNKLLFRIIGLIFFLCALVSAGNLSSLFASFFGISLFSYSAINFYQRKLAASKASFVGLITNLGADSMILFAAIASVFGIGLLGVGMESELNLSGIRLEDSLFPLLFINPELLIFIAILMFITLLIKGAQVGFSFWALDASVAPSLVLAVLNAFVIPIGAFIVLYHTKGLLNKTDLLPVLAVFGITSAILAILVACFIHDIKRILCYSTISQTGLIIVSTSCQASVFAPLVLIALHGVAKSMLYLSYAQVSQAASGEKDIRNIGGVGKILKTSMLATAVADLMLVFNVFIAFMSADSLLKISLGSLVLILTIISEYRLFGSVFLGQIRGEDAVIARIKKENLGTRVCFISFIIFALLFSGTSISLFKVMVNSQELSQNIGLLFALIFMIGIIGVYFALHHNISLGQKIETSFPMLHNFLRDGMGASWLYYQKIPAFIKRLGIDLNNLSTRTTAKLSNLNAEMANTMADYASLRNKGGKILYLYIIFTGLILLIAVAIAALEGV